MPVTAMQKVALPISVLEMKWTQWLRMSPEALAIIASLAEEPGSRPNLARLTAFSYAPFWNGPR